MSAAIEHAQSTVAKASLARTLRPLWGVAAASTKKNNFFSNRQMDKKPSIDPRIRHFSFQGAFARFCHLLHKGRVIVLYIRLLCS